MEVKSAQKREIKKSRQQTERGREMRLQMRYFGTSFGCRGVPGAPG